MSLRIATRLEQQVARTINPNWQFDSLGSTAAEYRAGLGLFQCACDFVGRFIDVPAVEEELSVQAFFGAVCS